MSEEDFKRLLEQYLEPHQDPNPEMEGTEILWIEGDPKVGARHMLEQHRVTKEEVEEVLVFMPPMVKARRSKDHPHRTLFWGATKQDRHLFIACEDEVVDDVRRLTPITAFEPDDGENYWRRHGRK